MRKWIVVAMAGLLGAGCDEGTGINTTQVAVAFSASAPSSIMGFGGTVARSIDVPGSNGVLTMDTVHVIVNEFELERVSALAGCDLTSMDDDDCEELESGPTFLRLPLDGGTTTAVTAEITVGEYRGVEFEIEDLEDDEDDPVEAQEIEELRNQILAEFDDWPRKASVRIVGTFTPTSGQPVSFLVYAEAEIEVELAFDTPFVVTEEDVSRTITVELDPSDWVKLGDGSVLNLAQYDYPTTGLVPEFEVEIENGFKRVEHDG